GPPWPPGRRRRRGRCGWAWACSPGTGSCSPPRRCWQWPSGCGCCPAAPPGGWACPTACPSGAPACGPRGPGRTRPGTCGCSPAASWTPGCGTSTGTCSGWSRRPAAGSPCPGPARRAAARWRCTRAWTTTPGPSPTGRWPRSRARRRSSSTRPGAAPRCATTAGCWVRRRRRPSPPGSATCTSGWPTGSTAWPPRRAPGGTGRAVPGWPSRTPATCATSSGPTGRCGSCWRPSPTSSSWTTRACAAGPAAPTPWSSPSSPGRCGTGSWRPSPAAVRRWSPRPTPAARCTSPPPGSTSSTPARSSPGRWPAPARSAHLPQPPGPDVVDGAPDDVAVGQVGGRPHPGDRRPHRGVEVVEAAEGERRPLAGLGLDLVGQRLVVEAVQAAVGVVDDEHLAGAELALRQRERPQDVVGDDAAGVADEVHLAERQAQGGEQVEAGVHAGHDRGPPGRPGRRQVAAGAGRVEGGGERGVGGDQLVDRRRTGRGVVGAARHGRPGCSRRPGARKGAPSGGGEAPPVVLVVVALEEATEVVDHPVERLGGEEDRLVAGDVVVLRAHGPDVPGPDVGVAEHLDLAVGRQQPGAVGLELAVLPHDAELE